MNTQNNSTNTAFALHAWHQITTVLPKYFLLSFLLLSPRSKKTAVLNTVLIIINMCCHHYKQDGARWR